MPKRQRAEYMREYREKTTTYSESNREAARRRYWEKIGKPVPERKRRYSGRIKVTVDSGVISNSSLSAPDSQSLEETNDGS